ncbi:GNAT family N-acetyltransferase [Nonomuraea sp. KC401]|uniref:GNAT family N-acetyltransferase n=1 Tax=unclassified Nonomuraea TaxID=2593643 RepID=UPI0010FE3DBB|nr:MULTISPECIES: GNAT family N-acetyltransferase [unclassified Nonomuraea]NBF00045.1 GNAT family N-acetyltransferase [Nonomuraea sp. K271]TLF50513.1 GNAT family N-acetyltransferase [Nonomuraea sp. KC401]
MRRLTIDDLDACIHLAKDRGWPPEEHKWRLLFEIGEPYGIDADDGDGLAACNVLTLYGDAHAVISMVLTASRYTRRGLARALMRHVLDRAGERSVFLHATEQGRSLYEQLGFRTTGRVAKHTGVFAGEPSGTTRPATVADLDAILALDAEVFGMDRSAALRRMFTFGEQVRVAPGGFGQCWRNDDTTVIGPVVADDEKTARALIGDLALDAGGEVRMDFDLAHESMIRWAGEHGIGEPWEVSLMVRGDDLPGDRSRQFLPFMQALG